MKSVKTKSPPHYVAPPIMKHPSGALIKSSTRAGNFISNVSYQEFFRNMLLNSSLNGVSKIGMSQNYVCSLVWTVVLITGIVGCVYQSMEFFRAYKEYPAVVQLEVKTQRTLEFPAVTVCNLNTVRKTAFFCKLMPYLLNPKLCEEMNITVMNSKQLSRIQSIYDLEENVIVELGHQLKDFIVYCSFMENECEYQGMRFSHFYNVIYGNCYTFNSQLDDDVTGPVVNRIGSHSGLNLELNLEVNEVFSRSVGARVVIHSPHLIPNPDTEGIDIPPGVKTSIAIQKISNFYLAAPYSDNCSDSSVLNSANSGQRGDYTEERCRENCRQKAIIEKCGCALPFFQKDPDIENCFFSAKHQAFDNCIKTVEPRCDCQRSCHKIHYSMTISSSNWPGGELSTYYMRFGFRNMDEARGNMTRLKVYYQTLEHLIYKNTPKYEPNEILSVLGGFTGLWLGVSLVALFECLENLVAAVSFFCKRQLVHRRLQNVSPVTNKVNDIRY